MADNRQMWQELGIDMKIHDQLLAALPQMFAGAFGKLKNRPEGMKYFNMVVSDIHGIRVQELMEKKKAGAKVVATFCVYVPEDLTWAAGAEQIGLCGGAHFTVPAGEELLPRNLCPLIKSSLGFKLMKICPYTESSDLIVGETTCDGKKKMFEILGGIKPTYTIVVPPSQDQASRNYFVGKLQEYKDKLESLTGKKVTAEILTEKSRILEEKKKAMRRIENARKNDPAPISGLDALLISQISFYDDPVRFAQMTNQLADELEQRVKKGDGIYPQGTPRLIVSGTPQAIPFWKIPEVVEKTGGVVVAEESCVGTRYTMTKAGQQGKTVDELLGRIADRLLETPCACFTPNPARADSIVRMFKEYKANGVILSNLQFCGPYTVESELVEKRLKAEKIPFLRLDVDYSAEDFGQIQLRVQAFLERLK
jgi:benzoyl-CoA reductase/2-hydroxyglutaryl-CoA dehydratase subunit BcrC/BadD/HgdB